MRACGGEATPRDPIRQRPLLSDMPSLDSRSACIRGGRYLARVRASWIDTGDRRGRGEGGVTMRRAQRGGVMPLVRLALAVLGAVLSWACQESVVPSPSVPVGPREVRGILINHDIGPDDPHDTALVRGQLFERNGCLWIREAPEIEYVPLWPPNYTLIDDGGSLWVIDDAGRAVWQLPALVHVGGGIAPPAGLRELVPGGIPPACLDAQYWAVSEVLP